MHGDFYKLINDDHCDLSINSSAEYSVSITLGTDIKKEIMGKSCPAVHCTCWRVILINAHLP